ncbi:hypothetical protein CU098_008631, partial [Rhizopus stolonifer]
MKRNKFDKHVDYILCSFFKVRASQAYIIKFKSRYSCWFPLSILKLLAIANIIHTVKTSKRNPYARPDEKKNARSVWCHQHNGLPLGEVTIEMDILR